MSTDTSISNISATEDYEPPDAGQLASILDKGGRVRSWQINSRSSTPFVEAKPIDVDGLRADAIRAKQNLARLIGEDAVEKVRHSFDRIHYWKTEAIHYATHCSTLHKASPEDWPSLSRMTVEEIRQSIPDIFYWLAEARHYENHYTFESQKALRKSQKALQKKQLKLPKTNPSGSGVQQEIRAKAITSKSKEEVLSLKRPTSGIRKRTRTQDASSNSKREVSAIGTRRSQRIKDRERTAVKEGHTHSS
jgi:hypothetical protein